MRFGSIYKITSNNGVVETNVKKIRDYSEAVSETIHEERVQIMRISDFDTIVEQMHIDHALEDHGAFVEHGKDGKLYVVKSWVTKDDAK